MLSRLYALLLVLVVFGSSLAVFGEWGIFVTIAVLLVAAILQRKGPQLLVWLLLVILLLILLLPAVYSRRESSRRGWCMNNLHNIALALSSYENRHKCFPLACIKDNEGRPMHGWRVLMMPYLDHKDLYLQYNFNEPWDGPNNRKLLDKRPTILACPSSATAYQNKTATSYVAVVGKNTAWPTGKPLGMDELVKRKAADNTVVLIEVPCDIPWTQPRDFDLDAFESGGTLSAAIQREAVHLADESLFYRYKSRMLAIAFADGHSDLMPAAAFASDKIHDWLAVGGYNEDEIDAYGREFKWPNCIALLVWLASVAELFRQARRSGRLLRKNNMPE
jgi:hypothetical protein